MKPVEATPEQIAMWAERDGGHAIPMVIGGPEEAPDVIPCPALVMTTFHSTPSGDGMVTLTPQRLYHVAFQLDEIEVAHLARGGTLWMTTWGGLPVHLIEVEAP